MKFRELRALSLALLPCLSAACASTVGNAITPLKVVRESRATLRVRPDRDGLPDQPVSGWTESADVTAVLRCRFYAVEPKWIERALGDRFASAFAVTGSTEDVQRLCRELEQVGAVPVAPPILELRGERRGSCSVIRQTAYVAGFDIEVVPGVAAVADPQISIARDGLVLEAGIGTELDGARAVDLGLTTCDLELRDRNVNLFLDAPPVRVQVPRGESRTLNVANRLAKGEAMVCGGTSLAVSGRRGFVAVVEILEASDGTR